jgi:hypothetical protein
VPSTSEEFLKLAPHAEKATVADATHMVAGDNNDHFMGAAIAPFLKRQAPRSKQVMMTILFFCRCWASAWPAPISRPRS